jgi:hypothetical protein
MPLIEAVGKLILAGNCQDENQKRKFMVRLWHRIAASLFFPLRHSILIPAERFAADATDEHAPQAWTVARAVVVASLGTTP